MESDGDFKEKEGREEAGEMELSHKLGGREEKVKARSNEGMNTKET